MKMLTDELYIELCSLFLVENFSLEECQDELEISNEELEEAVTRLSSDGYIIMHTLH